MSNPYKKFSDADETARRRQDARLDDLRSLIDRIVDDAQSKGLFENLPGAGKPLNLEEPDPYSYDQRIAYKLLKDNNYTLPWIAERNEMLAQIEQFRQGLSVTWLDYRQHYHTAPSETHRMALRLDWTRQCGRFFMIRIKYIFDNSFRFCLHTHYPVMSVHLIVKEILQLPVSTVHFFAKADYIIR